MLINESTGSKFLSLPSVFSYLLVKIFRVNVFLYKYCRYQRDQEDRDREALLTRRFERNDADTSVMIDAALQHNTKLNDVNREMDNLLGSGSSILTNLQEQRFTLKGAHKKILDIANTLGMSNTVMRFIERRTSQDRYILFAGMIVTCVIMFLAWKYLT